MITAKAANIDDYIAAFPDSTQKILQQVRTAIKKAAPQAEETISYSMPAFRQEGILVYFAAYKNHIGFYPTASGIANFQQDLARFKNSKGAVQFPIDEPMPLELISRIVKYRVKENQDRAKNKTAKSKNE